MRWRPNLSSKTEVIGISPPYTREMNKKLNEHNLSRQKKGQGTKIEQTTEDRKRQTKNRTPKLISVAILEDAQKPLTRAYLPECLWIDILEVQRQVMRREVSFTCGGTRKNGSGMKSAQARNENENNAQRWKIKNTKTELARELRCSGVQDRNTGEAACSQTNGGETIEYGALWRHPKRSSESNFCIEFCVKKP